MKRLLSTSIVVLLAGVAFAQESFVQLPADSTGKKLRMFQQTVGANTVYLQGFYWANTAGNEVGLVGSPVFVQFSDGAASYVGAKTGQFPAALDGSGFLKVHEQGTATISGTVTANAGSGTFTVGGTVTANAGSGTFNIQANASMNETQIAGTAIDVNSGSKSAGTQRIVIATDQPALTNALKVDGSGATQPVSGTVTSNQGTAAAIANAWPFRLTDLTNYMPTMDAAARRGYVQVTDGTNNATVTAGGSVNVNCTGGCTSGGSFADSSAFTFGTTAVGNMSAVVDDVSTNTVAENSAGAVRMNTNRILYVDLSKTAVNATAVKVDGSAVTQPVSQATGTNLHAVIDSGSTTAVTQATGTNLHAVLDTTSTTAVTQATGTNLHSVVDSGSITATQATGTNLHVVVDTAPTTAVTNTGLTDLDATTQTVTNGTAGTKSQLVGIVFNTALPTLTNGQGAAAQATSKGEIIVAQPTAADLNATVTGTVTTTPPANASTNVAQVAGTTTDTNSGLKSAGTIRVVLATDQPALTNKLLVTPDALPANQSINVAQIGGTNTVTGGVGGIIAVGGNVANAVAATANPVPVGGIFTTTPATLTTGQTATLQFTAAQNTKQDITTIAGTAPTTVGKLDVKGADGDVFVRQAAAANLNATAVQGAAGTAAAAWFAKATDGTNTAAVKAASTAAAATDPALVVAISPNNTVPINQTQVGSTTIAVDNGISGTGVQRVTLAQELTYSAGTTIKTNTAAGTGVFFALCGSATKTVSVQRLSISGTVATAAVWGDVIVRRTSTATSAGTATTLTVGPYDSTSTAGTATAKFYTALATAGTLTNVIESQTVLFPITAISATLQPAAGSVIFRWRDQDSGSPVLRGTAQCVEAAFGTTTTNAPTLNVAVTWTER